MAKLILFDAQGEAEKLLREVMKRDRYPSALRDTLAAYLENMTVRTFADAGIAVLTTDAKRKY